MHIAILGATSQIARDFVSAAATTGKYRFSLYARRPEAAQHWARQHSLRCIEQVDKFVNFSRNTCYDALMNFVGVGDPAATQNMGALILDTTLEFDTLALDYLKTHPKTRYIFLSSGAVYGSDFSQAITEGTPAQFNINSLNAQDWYGAAKFYSECRHRALVDLPIVDIRVFSYFSRTQDLSARFLITDMLRAVRDKTVLKTSSDHIVRDFLHPSDFFRLVQAVLEAPCTNEAVDCYTRAPVNRSELLLAMQSHFGLRYEVIESSVGVNATGYKPHYYSLNKRAASFGYQPSLTSWEGLLMETTAVLADAK